MARDPILSAFSVQKERRSDAALVVSGSRHATVGDVDAIARSIEHRIGASGVSRGSLVALGGLNGAPFLGALLACWRAGAVVLLVDRRTPELERDRLASTFGASIALFARTPLASGGDLGVEIRRTSASSDALRPPFSRPKLEGAGVVKLTSGSSGTPRGAVASTEALAADDEGLRASMGVRADDRLLATVPFSHSYGLSSLVVPALTVGTRLVVPSDLQPFAPLVAASEHAATVFPTVPAYLQAIVRMAEPPPPPPAMRLVLTAGAPLDAETSSRFHARFGRPVHVFYGASEVGGICFDREGGAAERGTVGAPVEGVDVALDPVGTVDPHEGRRGRVVVRSAAIAAGYVPEDRGRLDGSRFVTSDLATWRAGELVLRGRLDDVINVKGKKVDPTEVEAVIGQLGPVEECSVLAVHPNGATEPVVRAVIACRSRSLDASDVHAWCKSRLPDHKIPRSVLIVDRLPRTERGKLDRAALRRMEA